MSGTFVDDRNDVRLLARSGVVVRGGGDLDLALEVDIPVDGSFNVVSLQHQSSMLCRSLIIALSTNIC